METMEEKMQYKKSDFYYELPEELIAQTPAEPRDSSRLLIYDTKTKKAEDKIFRDIVDYIRPGDVLVVNNTKVIPARLYALTEHGGSCGGAASQKIRFGKMGSIDAAREKGKNRRENESK